MLLQGEIVEILARHGFAEIVSWELIPTDEGAQVILTPLVGLDLGEGRFRKLNQDLSRVEGVDRVMIAIPK